VAVRRPPRGGNCQDDDAESKHRQTHEFENQSVHVEIPQTNRQVCWEAIERRLIFGGSWWPAHTMFRGKVNDSRSAEGLQHALMRLRRIGVIRKCRLLLIGF